MDNSAFPSQLDTFRNLPKVDLHRHLEGSLRIESLLDIARDHGITLPLHPDLRSLVQMQPSDPFTFSTFLSKFQTIRLFYRSPDIITRLTYEAVEDAALDGVTYLELRFTPVALSRAQGFPLDDVMEWVIQGAHRAEHDFGITTRLIVSVNRHEPVEMAENVLRLATERQSKGVVGVDLAGNEAEFSADPFISLFRDARASGLSITVHAGEWNGAQNIRQAIEDLGAARIGHGVRVMEDPAVVALARERNTTFEVCVTSNYQTGVVTALNEHPLVNMLQAGLNVTLNTDDPSISQITLSQEYRQAVETLGLSKEILRERILAAAEASFLPINQRRRLVERLRLHLTGIRRPSKS